MENNEISKSNRIKIIVITALIFLVSIAGISYAYFTIQITGNDTASSMRLRTANMSLVYNDVQIVSGEYATPGWSDTKTLTVTNTGNVTVYYNIIWRDLYNEITNGELIISAECSSSSGTCDDIDDIVVTTEVPEVHNVAIKNNITIAPGVTHTYILIAEFIETGSNQNYNQNKFFNGTINISEGSEPRALRAGDEVTYGSEHFYVVSTDTTNTVLLAKYNLLVGDTYNNSTAVYTPISTSSSGYGLQNSTARGWMNDETNWVGVVPFSGTNYWDDEVCQYTNSSWSCTGTSNLKSEYATNGESYNDEPYPYVYKSTMTTAPTFYTSGGSKYIQNNGYTIAYYVEEYLTRLKREKGVPSTATARLLKHEELYALWDIADYDVDTTTCNTTGTQMMMSMYSMDATTAAYAASILCSGGGLDMGYVVDQTLAMALSTNTITPEYYEALGLSNVKLTGRDILYNSTFWLGSARNDNNVWNVSTRGDLYDSDFDYVDSRGVRPVIVVSTSDISA